MPTRFLKVPHIQQKADGECLVACAAMMLEVAGFRADYAQIRRLLGTLSAGTPHSRITRLSRIHADLQIIYRVGNLDDVIAYLDNGFPVTLFVNTLDLPYWGELSGHAVVVVGYTEHDFYLHDPNFSHAPQSVSYGNLALAWDAYEYYLAVMQRKQKSK